MDGLVPKRIHWFHCTLSLGDPLSHAIRADLGRTTEDHPWKARKWVVARMTDWVDPPRDADVLQTMRLVHIGSKANFLARFCTALFLGISDFHYGCGSFSDVA